MHPDSATHPAHRLDRLARDDKWYLACGDGIVWAPPFPRWLDVPGFWDEALVHYHPFAPVFTVALVHGRGDADPLTLVDRRWRPDRLTVHWRTAGGAVLVERRFALPGGRLATEWTPGEGRSWSDLPDGTHLVAFTAQPGEAVEALRETSDRRGLQWSRTVHDRHGELAVVDASLHASSGDARAAAGRAEGADPPPRWDHSPFWEWWRLAGAPPDDVRIDGLSSAGSVWMAVAQPAAGDGPRTFVATLSPRFAPVAAAADHSSAAAEQHWMGVLGQFPRFTCSDPYFDRYYDYRAYGLGLNRVGPDAGNVRWPAVAEGIGYFHVPITYSAQCHMWEMRWAADPTVAQGTLRNFIAHQRPDGSFHGRLYSTHLRHTDFYHANWGDAVLAVDALHPDEPFLEEAYDALARYARWLDASRDPDGTGMYDVVNHYETGQEYMSRYQVVDAEADARGWVSGMRLKGIDVTVYAHQLQRALAVIADRLGRAAESGAWRAGADRIGAALLEEMWDEALGFFTDVDPRTGRRTGVLAGVGFYPLLTDLLDDAHVRRLLEALEDPERFATPFPIPSSSVSDPAFDATARWKGKRHQCPWNGRVWPMVNSHVVEGLVRQWQAGRRFVGERAAGLLAAFVGMMFHDGDPARPNCYEHYNPVTGQPSVYRGIDDYQHSWVLDLLLRGVAGIDPGPAGLRVDPLPLDVASVTVDGVFRGRRVVLERSGADLHVTLDTAPHRTRVGTPAVLPW